MRNPLLRIPSKCFKSSSARVRRICRAKSSSTTAPRTLADGRWHLIAAPETNDAPLAIRQQVIVYDAHLPAGREIEIPQADGMQQLLYVFDGEISAGSTHLLKGDAIADDEEPLPAIKAIRPSSLVAFLVDRRAHATRAGTISGG